MTRLLLLITAIFAQPALARWEPSPIDGWQEIRFQGQTRYSQQTDCVLAQADGSASGLIQAVESTLKQRPMLSWSWQADQPLTPRPKAGEKDKAGDDYLARVYVIKEGFFPWQTKAINYVWSRQHPVGSHWPNPFVSNAIMVVVQTGDEGLGQWQSFQRDVAADFRRYHDMEVDKVDAVAVMTDSDNSAGQATACYRLPQFR
ncbi:MAG: DUF3047 domain-containing protein [Alcanivoracaceae bacterium]|jgi:hypothetical protein|nr:DUF3047 domain-containing protein [Alcanivoracaceae bacterium]